MSTQRAGSESELTRPADVCARLDIQPYILKFWESEFPVLGRRVGAKRLYDGAAFEMVREIRRLVLDERRSLGEARTALDSRFGEDAGAAPAPVEVAAAEALSGAGTEAPEALREELRHALERLGLLERELEASQELLRKVPSLQARVAELEDALARADADKRGALAAQAAELGADLTKAREATRGREDELRRAREDAAEVRRQLEEEKLARIKVATEAARVREMAEQLARLERDVVAERQRHGETSALLDGLRARQAELGRRDLEWRADVSKTISAALREVREIAFHAEGLEKALEPVESRPRRSAPIPPAPVPGPPADIEDLAAEALQESLAVAEKPDDETERGAAPAPGNGQTNGGGNGAANGPGGPHTD